MLLDEINYPSDLKKLSIDELILLAKEIRSYIVELVSTKEGHLGASLGVVELTLVLHYLYNTPTDKLVWDVGHQAYAHKLITGRRGRFNSNRQKEGLSGFPKISESEFDSFGTGHSSTSISAVLGMALASKIKGEERNHIAVIGDASIASGMAFEGLNNAGVSDSNILVVLNDNSMAIDPFVGAMKDYLSELRNSNKGGSSSNHKNKSGKNIFENLNFSYFGPVDGHDIAELIRILEEVKNTSGPKFLHVVTTKGKGYKRAEEDQTRFHAPGKFDIETGNSFNVDVENSPIKYQDVFGQTIVELADKYDNVVGITPAMVTGSSLNYMIDKYPDRAFDVGIAEQHAVTLAAGMATQGLKPFVVIYSTFLQRAYDQVVHDVALQNLPVVFCIDRGGVVGEDGATHHGIFDIAWLRSIPNMIVSAPMNENDLRNLMQTAAKSKSPFSIRYPRGKGVVSNWKNKLVELEIGKAEIVKSGTEIAVLTFGHPGNFALEAVNMLDETAKNKVGVINMLFVKPIDETMLDSVFSNYKTVITVEDGIKIGGLGSAVIEWANTNHRKNKIIVLGVEDVFLDHAKPSELYNTMGVSAVEIKKTISRLLIENKDF